MIIPRFYDNLEEHFSPKRILLVFGPRRVGKTTLLNGMLDRTHLRYKFDTGENLSTQHVLGAQETRVLNRYVDDFQLIALDEAQNITNIGMGLKMIIDAHPDLKMIATGSSSFDLRLRTSEPLTGRKTLILLFPISQIELRQLYSPYDLRLQLDERLVLGSYPDVLTASTIDEKITVLKELADAYLFKDVLAIEGRKGSKFITDLAKMLALQVGYEVSTNELATNLGVDAKTIERYLDLLEQTFVIFRLGSFSRNLRSELRRKQKFYFYDTGVRNAIIGQFNELNSRNDVGALWENFIVAERLKKRSYHNIYGSSYFWRTHSQKEIDLVEERDGKLFAFECKWSTRKEVKPPREWTTNYPEAEFKVITPENYLEFVT